MTEPQTQQRPEYDPAISDLARSLINATVKESQKLPTDDSQLDKVLKHIQRGTGDNTFIAITALSAYVQAKASERQATALESIAKTASRVQMSETTDTNAQAIVDQRESKRDYLASTYSLDTDTLTFLWAFRGILIDASIKSLSRPDRFDPYRRVTNEEVAWALRLTSEQLLARLPRMDNDSLTSAPIDYGLLEAFDIQHYGGGEHTPDDWMFNG